MTISIRKCYAAGGSAIDEWDMEMNGCSVRRTCGESDCTPALPEGVMREIIHIVDHENDSPQSYVWAVADLINDQSSCISACLANYLGCELRRSVEKRYVEKTKSWRRTDNQMVAWVNFISVENSDVSMKNLELTVIPDHPNMRWDGWTEWQWPLDITRKVADIMIGGPVAKKMFAQRRTANKPALCASPCAFAFGKGFTVSSL